mgnify:CR=1
MRVGKRIKVAGFTLIELLVTLAVAVILATVAVPGFQGMMARNQMATDVNSMLAGLNYARSESIKRRENVSLVVVSGGAGWVVRVRDLDEQTLREIKSSNSKVSLGLSSDYSVVFSALGRMAANGNNCSGGCDISLSSGGQCREVVVSSLGRVGSRECEILP